MNIDFFPLNRGCVVLHSVCQWHFQQFCSPWKELFWVENKFFIGKFLCRVSGVYELSNSVPSICQRIVKLSIWCLRIVKLGILCLQNVKHSIWGFLIVNLSIRCLRIVKLSIWCLRIVKLSAEFLVFTNCLMFSKSDLESLRLGACLVQVPTSHHRELHHLLPEITESLYKLWEVVHVLDADAPHSVGLLVQEELLHYNIICEQQNLKFENHSFE